MAGRQQKHSAGANEAGEAQGRDDLGRNGRHVPVNVTVRSFVPVCTAGCQ
jgi:hypothetical protein